MDTKNIQLISIIFLSLLILAITWHKMKPGIGPQNLKVIGLISITVLSAIFGFTSDSSTQAVLGIFSAIAGYLFGSSSENPSEQRTNFDSRGDNNQIAGRDINNNIEKMVSEIRQGILNNASKSYHVHLIYKEIWQAMRSGNTENLIRDTIKRFTDNGFSLSSISSDLKGTDGLIFVFEKADGKNEISSSRD